MSAEVHKQWSLKTNRRWVNPAMRDPAERSWRSTGILPVGPIGVSLVARRQQAGSPLAPQARCLCYDLQRDHLGGLDVLARANFSEQHFIGSSVEVEHGEGGAARLIPAK